MIISKPLASRLYRRPFAKDFIADSTCATVKNEDEASTAVGKKIYHDCMEPITPYASWVLSKL
jgi:hypothetical protein